MKYVTSEIYRSLRSKGHDPEIGIRKNFAMPPEDMGDRRFKFTVSTSDKDRSGDIIIQDGWQLDQYRENPVVLWQHNSMELPIGRAISIGIEDGKLKAVVEFADGADNPKAEQVYQLVKKGFLNATSVGFLSVKDQPLDDDSWGLLYTQTDLCEFSIVNAPDNPWALIEPNQRSVVADDKTSKPEDKSIGDINNFDQASHDRRLRKLNLRGRVRKGT